MFPHVFRIVNGRKMFVSMQIYEFLSKSQRAFNSADILCGCLSLCKETNFIHFPIPHKLTITGSCCNAGITFSIKSLVFILRLDVLMQGWNPTYSLCRTSLSMSNCTTRSWSFISPNTDTEPKYANKSKNTSSRQAEIN